VNCLVFAAALVLAAAGAASADVDDDDIGDHTDNADEPFELTPRTATARLVAGRTVILSARFETDVHGPVPRGTTRSIPLPERGVITAATVRIGTHVERLVLAPVAAVEGRFEAVYTKPGRGSARRWAVRINGATGAATLEIAAPRRARVEVDLTVEVETCFADDARHFTVPAAWPSVIDGATTALAAAVDTLDERCPDAGGGEWLSVSAQTLVHKPAGEQRIGIDAARLALGKGDVARIEIALASRLTKIPDDLYTVFVLDHSRSMTTKDIETQRAIITSYIAQAPHGRVQLVGYARHAQTLLPGWIGGARATARIERVLGNVAARNGSNVDRGIAAAGALLATVRGTRRVIVFNDGRLASRVSEDIATAGAGLPDGTIVNTVELVGHQATAVERSDDSIIAPIAAATEGIAMFASGARSTVNAELIDVLPLLRPVSLDNIAITAPGWSADAFGASRCTDADPIAESDSCLWHATGSALAGPVTVTGMLWGHRVTRVLVPDARAGRSLARALSTLSSIPTELVDEILTAARAVNTAWSMFGMWGPEGGYGDLDQFGQFTCGSMSTSSQLVSHSLTSVGTPARNIRLELLAQLGAAVRACKPRGKVIAGIETTNDEIVDVTLMVSDPLDLPLQTCLADGMWDTTLSLTRPPSHVSTWVVFEPQP
jgi:von Willebrand factor type A domain